MSKPNPKKPPAPVSPESFLREPLKVRQQLIDFIRDERRLSSRGEAQRALKEDDKICIGIFELLLDTGRLDLRRRSNGFTLLQDCALRGDLAPFRWLLTHGADPDARVEVGDSPAYVLGSQMAGWRVDDIAIVRGYSSMVQALAAERARRAIASVSRGAAPAPSLTGRSNRRLR